ncbi:helix-turn-helix transcriptional regulator [Christiangramia sabulilitoris]|uniref:DNA-binding response regulator n=1 Tax=Christiangramia sabulilitoris TaxID=2583991 RepID=A0A550I2D6_9FLAO|nr:LuxR C-terminal-related transcriptional regulator [Christiangramia sabulilitoris]TRO65142.1 DNA-binding response regulator [Christiangramia sabulilitoris]
MMEKRQLLIVSSNEDFVDKLVEQVSVNFEITRERSIHVAFNTALNLLPDTIFFDKTSYNRTSDFRNLKNFKSTHFLNKSFLFVYGKEEDLTILNKRYKAIIDEYLSDTMGIDQIALRIRRNVQSQCFNYWHDCFMGLFNLMAQPVVLLKQNNILLMNDSFKKTFRLDKTEGLKLTDFVNIENKAKVKTSLRNFSRGKHMKAVTKTSLLLHNDKLRNARISFSKLSRNITDQFIMMVDFSGNELQMDDSIGSHANQVEKCFEDNSELAEFSFTKREKEIISLLCKGYKTKEISDALFISPKTIEKHRSNIIKRTNSETILESIIFAINHNLVDLPKS